MKELWSIFLTFMKIGAFTFGGGYAMIPLIQKEAVENHKWVTDEDILNVVAIAESTPGPIAINAATFVGYQVAGFTYFMGVSSDPWNQVNDQYVRHNRLVITGYHLQNNADWYDGIFDPSTVLDSARN